MAEAERAGRLLLHLLRDDGPFHVGRPAGEHPRVPVPAGRGGPGRGGGRRASTRPGGGTSWPPTSGRPTASCWSPTRARRPLVDGLDLGLGPDRLLVADDDAYAPAAAGTPPPDGPAGAGALAGPALPAHLHLGLDRRAQGGPDDPGPGGPGRVRHGASAADDVLYSAMPLFHGNALSAAVLPAFASGATLALRRRFSASSFLPDVRAGAAPPSSTGGSGHRPHRGHPAHRPRPGPPAPLRARPGDIGAGQGGLHRAVRRPPLRGVRIERERHRAQPVPDARPGALGRASAATTTSSSSTRTPARSCPRPPSTTTAG